VSAARFVVGLTGGIGSGKSALAACFERLGAEHIDTDALARVVTAADGVAMPQIRAEFGPQVIAADGSLNRLAMRELVFGDPARRAQLEAILHPHIGNEVESRLATDRAGYVVLAVPLLFESGRMLRHVSRTLVVDLPPALQITRLLARPGMTDEIAQQIIAAQMGRVQRLARADDCVENIGDVGLLARSALCLHQVYSGLASAHAGKR
jgi:dephospho-CoA kinase